MSLVEAARMPITSALRGKTINHVEYDDECLTIVTTDGHHCRIGWRDRTTNELVPGSPSMEGLRCQVTINPVEGKGRLLSL